MEAAAQQVDDLKRSVGIRDLSKVTRKQFAEILKKAAEGEIGVEQLKLLVEAMPAFVQLQRETIDGLKKVVEGTQASQQSARHAISRQLGSCSRILETLAQGAQSDETRIKLAELALEIGRMGIEISRIIESMNRDNNNLWKTLAVTAGAVGLALVFVFSGGRIRLQ